MYPAAHFGEGVTRQHDQVAVDFGRGTVEEMGHLVAQLSSTIVIADSQ